MRPRAQIIAELVARRRALGVTQDQMATLMEVSQSNVSQFESAQHDPRLSTLQRYALMLERVEIFQAEVTESAE